MAIDLTNGHRDLSPHVGHEIEIVAYADGANVAIECVTCGSVLIDFDRPDSEEANR